MSKQPSVLPPGPPGLPPKPPGSDSYRRQDDRPLYRDEYYRSQPPPPPPRYEFRGNHDSRSSFDRRSPPRYVAPPPSTDSYRPRDQGFTFRQPPPPSIDFRQGDNYRPQHPIREARGRNRATQHSFDSHRRNDGHRSAQGSFRGRGGPRLASERAFLKTNRAPTPELMPGMDKDEGQEARYVTVDELSDSDEVDMDLSGDNEDEAATEQPKKKYARTDNEAADGDSAPRWSNPDPYTALPPPDESQKKKKDVVKLIRKARVNTSSESATKTEATTDDFISFDLGNSEEGSFKSIESAGEGVPGAPTGPRSTKRENIPEIDQYHQEPPLVLDDYQRGDKKQQDSQARPPLQQPPVMPKESIALNTLRLNQSLGSRKRNISDEIKPPPQIHETTKGKKPPSNGVIISQWRTRTGTDPTPWIDVDHSDTPNMGLWLHKEIMDFYQYVKPRDFEHYIRTKLIEELNTTVRKAYPTGHIKTFGSFPAGLYLPTADMDVVLVSDQYLTGGRALYCQSSNKIYKFHNFICDEKLPLRGSSEVVAKARVPLVKYVDKITGLKVDISFENTTGLIANKTFQEWKAEFPAMPIVVTVVKHFLAMRGLNEPVNGGIGGFSVTCLVVSLLQNMPQVQSRTMVPEHHLGEILMEFFNLYGNEFNLSTTAVQLKPPGYISKAYANVPYKASHPNKFCIIDPNNPSNDIAGGSTNTPLIRDSFSDAFLKLQQRMASLRYSTDRKNNSLLSCILGGDYSSFEAQRGHLAHIHEKLCGSVSGN